MSLVINQFELSIRQLAPGWKGLQRGGFKFEVKIEPAGISELKNAPSLATSQKVFAVFFSFISFGSLAAGVFLIHTNTLSSKICLAMVGGGSGLGFLTIAATILIYFKRRKDIMQRIERLEENFKGKVGQFINQNKDAIIERYKQYPNGVANISSGDLFILYAKGDAEGELYFSDDKKKPTERLDYYTAKSYENQTGKAHPLIFKS